ncbi:hypothetical protein [Actinomadura rayongensis]|nr:hypothetical protein [Actinomadura rayongensis]
MDARVDLPHEHQDVLAQAPGGEDVEALFRTTAARTSAARHPLL